MKKAIMATLALMLVSATGFVQTVSAATMPTVSTAATVNKTKANTVFHKHHHRRHHRKTNKAAF